MGCSGNCCQKFYIDYKPADWAAGVYDPGTDLAFIKDMLIYLEDFKPTPEFPNAKGAYYTCRHWNKETKLCTVYEQRPLMCRDFPYGKKCQYDEKCSELGIERDIIKK